MRREWPPAYGSEPESKYLINYLCLHRHWPVSVVPWSYIVPRLRPSCRSLPASLARTNFNNNYFLHTLHSLLIQQESTATVNARCTNGPCRRWYFTSRIFLHNFPLLISLTIQRASGRAPLSPPWSRKFTCHTFVFFIYTKIHKFTLPRYSFAPNTGTTCRSRDHYTSRSYRRKRDNVYRGHGLYIFPACPPAWHISLTRHSFFLLYIASAQDRAHLESEIRKAHVICVVYAIDNPHSFDRIPTYWLPYFRQLGVNVCFALLSIIERSFDHVSMLGSCYSCRQQNRLTERCSNKWGSWRRNSAYYEGV